MLLLPLIEDINFESESESEPEAPIYKGVTMLWEPERVCTKIDKDVDKVLNLDVDGRGIAQCFWKTSEC